MDFVKCSNVIILLSTKCAKLTQNLGWYRADWPLEKNISHIFAVKQTISLQTLSLEIKEEGGSYWPASHFTSSCKVLVTNCEWIIINNALSFKRVIRMIAIPKFQVINELAFSLWAFKHYPFSCFQYLVDYSVQVFIYSSMLFILFMCFTL